MSQIVLYDGIYYTIPDANDPPGWGGDLTEFLAALGGGSLTYSLLTGIAAGQVLASNGVGGITFVAAPSPNFPVFAPSATATAPSYSFGSSSNTGMYSQGAGALAFATNGHQALAIDASGNVSIEGGITTVGNISTDNITASGTLSATGVTSLASTLQVSGAATFLSSISLSNGLSVGGNVGITGTLGVVGSSALGSLTAGTTTLSGPLTINGGANNTALTQNVTSTAYNNQILFNRGAGNTTSIGPTGSQFNILTSEGIPIVFGTNNSEKLRVLSNGNVGIGTTSPTHLLEVNGTFAVNGVATAQTPTVGDNSTQIATTAFVAVNGAPTGSMFMWPTSTAPTGFLLCNGASLNTTTYARLFAVIGYLYGGSGASFNIPNMQDMFARGASGTRSVGTYQADGVGPIGINDPKHKHQVGYQSGGGGSGANQIENYGTGGNISTSLESTGITITGTTTETRPKNVALNYIIKY